MSDEQNPYQAPQAIELSHGYRIAPGGGPGVTPFASGRVLAFVAMVMIALVVLADLVLAVSTYMQIGLLQRKAGLPAGSVEAGSNFVRQALAGLFLSLASIASSVTFLMWFYRAYRNLPALGNMRLAHAPSGAVGWWFVPIASLVVPCQIALEIWRGSDPKAIDVKWPDKPAAASLVGWWWAFYLLMGVSGYAPTIVGASHVGQGALDALLAQSWAIFLSSWVTLPAGILAILFIRGVDRNQDQRMRVIDERAFASPSTSLPPSPNPRLSAFLDKISSPRPPGGDSPFAPPANRP